MERCDKGSRWIAGPKAESLLAAEYLACPGSAVLTAVYTLHSAVGRCFQLTHGERDVTKAVTALQQLARGAYLCGISTNTCKDVTKTCERSHYWLQSTLHVYTALCCRALFSTNTWRDVTKAVTALQQLAHGAYLCGCRNKLCLPSPSQTHV